MKMIRILFLLLGMFLSGVANAQEFCEKFFDNNCHFSLGWETAWENKREKFRFENKNSEYSQSISFFYSGKKVTLPSGSVSQWFYEASPNPANLDCGSVYIDNYPYKNYLNIYVDYYYKYAHVDAYANSTPLLAHSILKSNSNCFFYT